jgi:hypothetical protein
MAEFNNHLLDEGRKFPSNVAKSEAGPNTKAGKQEINLRRGRDSIAPDLCCRS